MKFSDTIERRPERCPTDLFQTKIECGLLEYIRTASNREGFTFRAFIEASIRLHKEESKPKRFKNKAR